MRKGQITTNIAPDFAAKRWVGLLGEIVDAPFLPICRSQIDIRFKCDDRPLAERMPGFHWMTGYGDYTRELGYALKRVGIEWDSWADPSCQTTVRVAMTSTPVPRTSAMRTWPRRTGASGRSLAISARMGKIISRGTGPLSRTETIFAAVPLTGTDVARFRRGWRTSSSAKGMPLSH